MASFARTIRRAMMFRDMNKQQKRLWKATHKGNKSSNAKANTKQRQMRKNAERE